MGINLLQNIDLSEIGEEVEFSLNTEIGEIKFHMDDELEVYSLLFHIDEKETQPSHPYDHISSLILTLEQLFSDSYDRDATAFQVNTKYHLGPEDSTNYYSISVRISSFI